MSCGTKIYTETVDKLDLRHGSPFTLITGTKQVGRGKGGGWRNRVRRGGGVVGAGRGGKLEGQWASVILTPMDPSLNLTREGTPRPSLRSSLSLSLRAVGRVSFKEGVHGALALSMCGGNWLGGGGRSGGV